MVFQVIKVSGYFIICLFYSFGLIYYDEPIKNGETITVGWKDAKMDPDMGIVIAPLLKTHFVKINPKIMPCFCTFTSPISYCICNSWYFTHSPVFSPNIFQFWTRLNAYKRQKMILVS
jgi:hypothetical protein